MRLFLASLSSVLLMSCAPSDGPAVTGAVVLPETTLPIFGDGYPATGDICRRVGESDLTRDFLDDSADLIACPEAWAGREGFAADLRAREVMRQDGYVVYSLPRDL